VPLLMREVASPADIELAEALRLYITSRWPLDDPDVVVTRFGRERGTELLAQIRQILREAGAWPVDWSQESYRKAIKRVRREFERRWPDLDAQAIDSLVSWWAYIWK
jgi:hypothetical protein